MNIRENLIFIKGEDKTVSVQSYKKENGKCYIKYINFDKEYGFSFSNIDFYKAKNIYSAYEVIVYKENIPVSGISDIVVFDEHIRLIYKNESHQLFQKNQLRLVKKELFEKKSRDVLDYLKKISKFIIIGNESESFLYKQYGKIINISSESILVKYLKREGFSNHEKRNSLIFPFGFNISQKNATENAMLNQLSVIEGPPGTGKTQTILNIIANAYVNGKTVAVVSNNNSATSNVIEKLEKYGVGFIAAFLGSSDNKKKFIANQITEYPDMTKWKLDFEDRRSIKDDLKKMQSNLDNMLEKQNHLAKLKEEKEAILVEQVYYNELYNKENSVIGYSFINRLTSKKSLRLLAELEEVYENNNEITLRYKIKNIFKYRLFTFKFYNHDSREITSVLQYIYYMRRLDELNNEINNLELTLEQFNFKDEMKKYSEKSMLILRDKIVSNKDKIPPRFTEDDLWKNFGEVIKEYSIILSTTHSLRNSISENYLFDYVIIDEASQVDIVTGALAFSCAKNAVIVGDLKQLPNVVSNDFKRLTNEIFKRYNIGEEYNYAEESLLSSIVKMYPKVAKTLLKEHYRCNPKIIGFCNEKFYNKELVILTENNVKNPLIIYKTVTGNHARDKVNQREIDVISKEVIPNLQKTDSIGIISPYRAQVNATKNQLNDEIEVDTVHKYQGREKDIVILSTVANELNEFVDDANLINVAVSRAVKQLILVVSSNEGMLNKKGNISDLIKYIQYNNCEIIDSKVRSVFDLLYKQYKKELLEVIKSSKKASKYDSENLVDILIDEVLSEDKYKHLSYAMHQPLRLLLRDKELLSEEEKTFVINPWTHTDFIIFNKIDKSPILVVEVDGYKYHDKNEKQQKRDKLKDSILNKYNIPIIRLKTTGSEEKDKLSRSLEDAINYREK